MYLTIRFKIDDLKSLLVCQSQKRFVLLINFVLKIYYRILLVVGINLMHI